MLLAFSIACAYNTLHFENVFWDCWGLFALVLSSVLGGFF